MESTADSGFTQFVEEIAGPLRQALIARFGPDVGDEATSDALMYAWIHWDRVMTMSNPVGYLYRVGESRANRQFGRRSLPFAQQWQQSGERWFEPKLAGALASLSSKQRAAVILVQGFEWTVSEVAEMWGVSFSTVRTHLDRAMTRLRRKLGVGS